MGESQKLGVIEILGMLMVMYIPEWCLHALDRHDTPKKGSWLNMAEIEFSALSGQCLDRRIADVETLRDEVDAWTKQRNVNRSTVNWRFTQTNARSKMERHYQNVKKLN